MLSLRKMLADKLRAATGSNQFDFITEHRGMFSLLGITPEQVAALRDKHAIYLVGDSRMNIAGLREELMDTLVTALMDVTQV